MATMKSFVKNFIILTLALLPAPALAANCTKASDLIEKMICSDAELSRADAAMNKAYFALLKTITAKDVRDALIESQKRWLKARTGEIWMGTLNNQEKHDSILNVIQNRTSSLIARPDLKSSNHPNLPSLERTILDQKQFLSRYTGGPYSGFKPECSILVSPGAYYDGSYWCGSQQTFQNKDRICSFYLEWASGHEMEVRIVANIVNGSLKISATCSTGYGTDEFPCPENDSGETKGNWNFSPEMETAHPITKSGLSKFDPDVYLLPSEKGSWLNECLTNPDYPHKSNP